MFPIRKYFINTIYKSNLSFPSEILEFILEYTHRLFQ